MHTDKYLKSPLISSNGNECKQNLKILTMNYTIHNTSIIPAHIYHLKTIALGNKFVNILTKYSSHEILLLLFKTSVIWIKYGRWYVVSFHLLPKGIIFCSSRHLLHASLRNACKILSEILSLAHFLSTPLKVNYIHC